MAPLGQPAVSAEAAITTKGGCPFAKSPLQVGLRVAITIHIYTRIYCMYSIHSKVFFLCCLLCVCFFFFVSVCIDVCASLRRCMIAFVCVYVKKLDTVMWYFFV